MVIQDDALTPTFSREGEATTARYTRIPEGSMLPDTAYRIVRDETMLDGIKPMRGTVRAWEPPTLLEYDFRNGHAPESVARWELSPADSGTRVIFRHSGMPYANANLMMPGWHVFLDHLGAVLDGAPPGDFDTPWRKLQDVYASRYGLEALTREP